MPCSSSTAGFWRNCGRGTDRTRSSRSARALLGCGASRIPTWIKTAISPDLGDSGETADLTIYRTIQEALTMCSPRGATCVNVSIEPTELSRDGGRRPRGALVAVRDNGGGLRPDHGCLADPDAERILALGGTLTVASGDAGSPGGCVPNDAHR